MYVLCPEYALGAHGTFLPDALALAGYAPAAGSSLSPNHRSIDDTLLRSETQGRTAPCPAAAIPGRAGGPTDDGPTSAGVVARDKGRGAGASQSSSTDDRRLHRPNWPLSAVDGACRLPTSTADQPSSPSQNASAAPPTGKDVMTSTQLNLALTDPSQVRRGGPAGSRTLIMLSSIGLEARGCPAH